MAKLKKILLKVCLVLLIIVPLAAFAHFMVFPQETRCILIDYSNFKKDGQIYFNPNTPKGNIDTLKELIKIASQRITAFYGQQLCNPKYIYCSSDADYNKYGGYNRGPALTNCKLGSYIVISTQGADSDIIAHETAHAELYERIGFYNDTFKIPAWFNEGLAMQNDYRNYYSEDTLKAYSENYTRLPDVTKLTTGKLFTTGTREQVMLNYMMAKHVVKLWYTPNKFTKFITGINSGKSFDEAYKCCN